MPNGNEPSPSAVAEAVARRSYGKLVALVATRTRDIAAAEDALSEAFAAALQDWPAHGVPTHPEAWLLTAARRRAIDAARRRRTVDESAEHLRLLAEELEAAREEDEVDERLSLMFACAHPAIDPAVRAPLILQTVLGFDAAAIGSAFLVSPATMAQRLVRAKRKIRDAGVPLQVPDSAALPERLDAVLDAIYATFVAGWTDPAGTDPRRRELAEEGVWLARLVVHRLPREAEAVGLLSLILHAHARRDARRDERGDFVPLAEQDCARWDRSMIEEAEKLLAHANGLPRIGRFQLEAAVQSAHSVRRFGRSSDWGAIVAIYDALLRVTDSPVVAVNRAVALAELRGPAAGLEALAPVGDDRRVRDYQPYWAARADLLARAGDPVAADEAYERAIGLESDPSLRSFLERRRRGGGGGSGR